MTFIQDKLAKTNLYVKELEAELDDKDQQITALLWEHRSMAIEIIGRLRNENEQLAELAQLVEEND